jgi:hypothetical protein
VNLSFRNPLYRLDVRCPSHAAMVSRFKQVQGEWGGFEYNGDLSPTMRPVFVR